MSLSAKNLILDMGQKHFHQKVSGKSKRMSKKLLYGRKSPQTPEVHRSRVP